MGVIAINVIRELEKLDYDVGFHVLNSNEININDYPPEVQKAIQKGFRQDSIGIFFSYPDIYPIVRCKINVGYTGADSTGWYETNNQLKPHESCNQFMDYMLTPSNYSKKIMENCGVNIPIWIFPHGIDTNLLKPKLRKIENKIVYSYCGELSDRKGSKELIQTFIDFHGNDDYAELILRANTHMYYYCGQEIEELCKPYKNIKLNWKNEGQEDILNYYYNSHVYLYPSRADWYGMTVLEALATGLPVIATETNGYFEFIGKYINKLWYNEVPINNDHPYLKGFPLGGIGLGVAAAGTLVNRIPNNKTQALTTLGLAAAGGLLSKAYTMHDEHSATKALEHVTNSLNTYKSF
jgi:glycosyltransferase involved in cell wall biosynthesis